LNWIVSNTLLSDDMMLCLVKFSLACWRKFMIFTGVRICTSKSLHQWKETLKMIQKIFKNVIGMPTERYVKAYPLKQHARGTT
jgi:hypothetical protein